ncbi:MAG: hypothetical protein V1726_00245 [Methanobacteriota archaeon]
MNEGFILSNKYRTMIFDAFTSGETRLDRIIKKHHIVPVVAKRVIAEFITEGLLVKKGDEYRLTPEGEKLGVTLQR